MAEGFNHLTETLSHKLSLIQSSISQLENNSGILSENMDATRSHFDSIAGSITKVITAGTDNKRGIIRAEESVAVIRESIGQLEKNIQIQDNMIHESSSAIEQMLANITSVASIVSQSSAHYADLKETSQGVRHTARHIGRPAMSEKTSNGQEVIGMISRKGNHPGGGKRDFVIIEIAAEIV